MAFHDDRLPPVVEQGATMGPRFNTGVLTTASGAEYRIQNHAQERLGANLASGLRNRADMDALRAHFRARRGRLHSFPFKDWSDFATARQQIGTTNGSAAAFPLFKRYISGGYIYDRLITKPVVATVLVYVADVLIGRGGGASQYQVSRTTGIVTLGATLAATTGATVEARCEFDVPVRYDLDDMDVELRTYQSHRWANISVIEVPE